MRKSFRAPWSTKLVSTTILFVAILGFVFYIAGGWGRYAILAVAVLALVFAIRGYHIRDGKLLILRLGWSAKLDLAELTSAEVNPAATMGSVRALGIGGLFGFVGRFHNSVLGSYKAYATNADNAVVLGFDGEKIVVTPDAPDEFVEAITSEAGINST